MTTATSTFTLKTSPDDILDITKKVQQAVINNNEHISEGLVCVFVPGSTAGISTLEYEPGLVKTDVPKLLQELMPEGPDYAHHQTWGDHNGHSHLRSFFLPPSLTIPVINGDLLLGTWQQIVFCEFDEKPRNRTIYCQIVGE